MPIFKPIYNMGIHHQEPLYSARLLFLKSVKGHNFVKKHDRVTTIVQILALVMVNKCVKFVDNSFNSMEVMGKVKLFHNNDNAAYADEDTRVMTISQLFFCEKQLS